MITVATEPLFRHCTTEHPRICRSPVALSKKARSSFLKCNYTSLPLSRARRSCNFKFHKCRPLGATSSEKSIAETSESSDIYFKETFNLKRTERAEGKIYVRLDREKDREDLLLTVGCNIEGKWVLHWGVSYKDDVGSEWDQPPVEMRPPDSVAIKDYAVETPLKIVEGDEFYETKINCNPSSGISAIHFVLKDEETGTWYQRQRRDFMIPITDHLHENKSDAATKKGIGIWPGLEQLSNLLNRTEGSKSKDTDTRTKCTDAQSPSTHGESIYEEQDILKEISVDNSLSISVKKCPETERSLVNLETDISGDVTLHWGVCRNNDRRWEVPSAPYPPQTTQFKKRALRTLLQPKANGGSLGSFTIDKDFSGFLFVIKVNENMWLKHMGNDFYIPLPYSGSPPNLAQSERQGSEESSIDSACPAETTETNIDSNNQTAYTDGFINEIRNLVNGISAEKKHRTKSKEAQENILQEIEKLAAEAYSIFRSVTLTPTFTEDVSTESEALKAPTKICSGTGSGFEILCQGFNWESHKSGRWYLELMEKATDLSTLGFTVIWLPPPTESVSPEGYMPRDLYNLNSRYGNIDQLKHLVKRLHDVGLKVLGDVVLNHRCAHYQNQNGVWNIFGGRLNWDDRAVVADDPHFQGRGNKSNGDNFHAAPNIDHSQDFVRKDIKEWLLWLREEIGYDGWRLDFVRGFWGGYVKDYLDATEPYFAVGEFWDSLNYTYGEMDHNQDAHRQRIIDWINATNGTAGAFDVTTKGILHSALGRCEYWRLSDEKGSPPGVVGWWPSRAVTFIENHDTGSTQGHWRFPNGKEMQGYAYILTHPGTPAIFFDHLFSHYRSEIASLMSLRTRNKIHCRSRVRIVKAERDVYAAIIDKKVAVKIGHGHFEPAGSDGHWSSAVEGGDYKVWELS